MNEKVYGFMRQGGVRWRPAVAAGLLLAWGAAWAAPPAGELQVWLQRMHEATRSRSYTGTLVVSSGQNMSSARIWHVCEGDQQVERVDSLTGTPRTVFRHNDQVLTVWPDSRLARVEKRESLGLLPDRLRTADASLGEHYHLRVPGHVERIAGVMAELIELQPRDKLRFGYKVWLAQHSGLVLKLQTLDANGQVLEQSAFSELQWGAPVKMGELLNAMQRQDGLRLERVQPAKVSLADQGWTLGEVPGFKPLGCHQRGGQAGPAAGLHCVYSDGLASVSLFLEPMAGKAPPKDSLMAVGATHTLRTQVQQHVATLMGEVPAAALKRFAGSLERRRSSP